jgi:dihydroneopterin aldolase
MITTIVLAGIEFEGRHGATALERKSTRKFQVNLEVDFDASAAERSDRLADTIDYSMMAEAIVTVGTGEPHRLLESLARRMLDTLRQRVAGARMFRLELRKLHPPSCAGHPAYSAVRVTGEGSGRTG